jgi:DNA-directed RNA polymerase subunit RPC12/RpoP
MNKCCICGRDLRYDFEIEVNRCEDCSMRLKWGKHLEKKIRKCSL